MDGDSVRRLLQPLSLTPHVSCLREQLFLRESRPVLLEGTLHEWARSRSWIRLLPIDRGAFK